MRTAPLGSVTEPPRAAYAVGRSVGPAVVRNRVRRRLRAAVVEHRSLLEPGRGYLLRAQADAARASYRELADAVGELLRRQAPEHAK